MNPEQLIESFLKETDYKYNDNVVLIITYGSRVTLTTNADSDLDILIITFKGNMYRQAMMIGDVPIDITIMSVDDAEQNIIYSKVKVSTYFDAVFMV